MVSKSAVALEGGRDGLAVGHIVAQRKERGIFFGGGSFSISQNIEPRLEIIYDIPKLLDQFATQVS